MAIILQNISKSYGSKVIFADFSLEFEEKKTSIIMGSSGIGKTTLMNIMLGLIQPDSGKIEGLAGKKISAVFQEDRLLENKSGIENILFVLKNPKNYTKKAKEVLNDAELLDFYAQKAAEYSGGMKRRLTLCRALISEYDILILDEPFKGLDDKIKPKIMQMIKKYAFDKTVIIITHDKNEAEFFDSSKRIHL